MAPLSPESFGSGKKIFSAGNIGQAISCEGDFL